MLHDWHNVVCSVFYSVSVQLRVEFSQTRNARKIACYSASESPYPSTDDITQWLSAWSVIALCSFFALYYIFFLNTL